MRPGRKIMDTFPTFSRGKLTPNPPLNSPLVRGLKRASLQPGAFGRRPPTRQISLAMARRFSAPYQSEPVSSLASWARNLAVFSVVAVLVSIIIVRFGFLEMKPALATFFGGLGVGALSILFGLAGFSAVWPNGSRGIGRALLFLPVGRGGLPLPRFSRPQNRHE